MYICFSKCSILSIVDSRFSYVNTFSAMASNLSMSTADASSATMTNFSPNYPMLRLLVWKNTLILNSSVRPGMQIEKKQGALFFSLRLCSVIKFISRFTSIGRGKVLAILLIEESSSTHLQVTQLSFRTT